MFYIYWDKHNGVHCRKVVGLFEKTTTVVRALINLRQIKIFSHNERGFRPPLCTYRVNCIRRTALQTQDSTFKHCLSEADHATSRPRWLPIILNIYEWVSEEETFVPLKPGYLGGNEPAISDFTEKKLQPRTIPGPIPVGHNGNHQLELNRNYYTYLCN